MDVILRNEVVETAKAGDKVNITGMPIVVPDVGQLFGKTAEARRDDFGGRGRGRSDILLYLTFGSLIISQRALGKRVSLV